MDKQDVKENRPSAATQGRRNIGTICNRGSMEACSICKGPVYVCNPKLNTPCRKKHCGICGYTFDIRYASDSTPICLKSLVRSETHRTISVNERE